MNKIAYNLRRIRKEKGETQQQTADALGVKRGTYATYEDKTPLPVELIEKLAGHWNVAIKEFVKDIPAHLSLKEQSNNNIHGVPYYPLDVSASNVEIFNDIPEQSTMRVLIPGFEDCEVALPVFGHSMYPTYENGSIVICKRINDLDVIQYGEVHLIVTKEQRLLKRIKKSDDKDSLLLVSDNYEAQKENKLRYEPFDLKKDKIKHLFIVKGSIKRNQI